MNNVLLKQALEIIASMTPQQIVDSMIEYGIKVSTDTDGILPEPVKQLPLTPELLQKLKVLSQGESFFDRTDSEGDPLTPDDLELNADDIFSTGYESGEIQLAREILFQLMGEEEYVKFASN
jgi:hypothetical protein